ncbi:hypothetical protein [Lentzea californiensis]|uniref:hypothetical protein n=1 Tax=Lentzea californiensis TaxID=438851 RepID=UPI00216455D3|nr:hypothetical protein [Lentzea californiensis]
MSATVWPFLNRKASDALCGYSVPPNAHSPSRPSLQRAARDAASWSTGNARPGDDKSTWWTRSTRGWRVLQRLGSRRRDELTGEEAKQPQQDRHRKLLFGSPGQQHQEPDESHRRIDLKRDHWSIRRLHAEAIRTAEVATDGPLERVVFAEDHQLLVDRERKIHHLREQPESLRMTRGNPRVRRVDAVGEGLEATEQTARQCRLDGLHLFRWKGLTQLANEVHSSMDLTRGVALGASGGRGYLTHHCVPPRL